MEPTDQPPSAAVSQGSGRADTLPFRLIAMAVVITEVVAIAAGCNQWVGQRIAIWTRGTSVTEFQHVVVSTQTFNWRVTRAPGESTRGLIAAFVLVAVVVVLSTVLIGYLVRRGTFWRAAVASLISVVFATQVAAIVSGFVYSPGGEFGVQGFSPGWTMYYGVSGPSANGVFVNGGIFDSNAVFGTSGPTGYRFVGGLILGVLVAIVVGLVARRLGDATSLDRPDPTPPPTPTQAFFPPGEMQRGYEAGIAGPPNPEGGRHSRD